MISAPAVVCPVCGSTECLVCKEDLGDDGMFFVCSPPHGCGTTFILTPQGNMTDIF